MSEIRKYLESHKDEMLGLLSELVAIPSVQGEALEGKPFGEEPARALAFMLEKCRDEGFAVESLTAYLTTYQSLI